MLVCVDIWGVHGAPASLSSALLLPCPVPPLTLAPEHLPIINSPTIPHPPPLLPPTSHCPFAHPASLRLLLSLPTHTYHCHLPAHCSAPACLPVTPPPRLPNCPLLWHHMVPSWLLLHPTWCWTQLGIAGTGLAPTALSRRGAEPAWLHRNPVSLGSVLLLPTLGLHLHGPHTPILCFSPAVAAFLPTSFPSPPTPCLPPATAIFPPSCHLSPPPLPPQLPSLCMVPGCMDGTTEHSRNWPSPHGMGWLPVSSPPLYSYLTWHFWVNGGEKQP